MFLRSTIFVYFAICEVSLTVHRCLDVDIDTTFWCVDFFSFAMFVVNFLGV